MTPPCSQDIPPETLSAWYDAMLTAHESQQLGEHIPTCVACQLHLQHFRDIHDILTRQPQLAPGTRIRDYLRQRIWQRHAPELTWSRIIRSGIATSVLVLLVAAFFFVLVNHQPGIVTPVATATLGQPTAIPTTKATVIVTPTLNPTATTQPTPSATPTTQPTSQPTGIAGTWESPQPGGYCYRLTITPTASTTINAQLATAQPSCTSAIIGGFPMSGTFDGTILNLKEIPATTALTRAAQMAHRQPAYPQANCGDTTLYGFFNTSAQSITGDVTVCSVATPMTFTRAG